MLLMDKEYQRETVKLRARNRILRKSVRDLKDYLDQWYSSHKHELDHESQLKVESLLAGAEYALMKETYDSQDR
jgi:hypothetical protein